MAHLPFDDDPEYQRPILTARHEHTEGEIADSLFGRPSLAAGIARDRLDSKPEGTFMATGIASHVWLDADGVAWIDDTNIKVIEVALERIAHGSSPEEIYDQHRGHLSLAQVHAALTFYFDHQAEMDAEIDRQVREFDALRGVTLNSPGRQRLRAQEKLRTG